VGWGCGRPSLGAFLHRRRRIPLVVRDPRDRRWPSSDFHGSIDAYTSTLAGALASNRGTDVSSTIEAALATLRERFDQDPTFRNYKVSEVTARSGLPSSSTFFVQNILSLSGLTWGGANQGEDYIYGRPKDTEDLSELNDLSKFLAYLRTGKSDRRLRPPP
jgi:hypothetical protein